MCSVGETGDPYLLPPAKMTAAMNCEKLPGIEFPDIYVYPSVYTGEAMKAYKSLDAYKYFESGKVNDVFIWRHNTKDNKHVYVIRSNKLTLQTFHHRVNAERVIEAPPSAIYLQIRAYHRPGAPKPGLMTFAKICGEEMQVGWVREKDIEAVEMAYGRGGVEDREVRLTAAYEKTDYIHFKYALCIS